LDSTILLQDLTAEERDAYSDTTQVVPDPVESAAVVAGAVVVVGTSTKVEVEEAGRVVLTRVVEVVDDSFEAVEAAAGVVATLVAMTVVCAGQD
jgi:hypothetical protein